MNIVEISDFYIVCIWFKESLIEDLVKISKTKPWQPRKLCWCGFRYFCCRKNMYVQLESHDVHSCFDTQQRSSSKKHDSSVFWGMIWISSLPLIILRPIYTTSNFGILVQINPAFPTQRVWETCVMDVTIQSVVSKLTEFEGKVAINSNDVCKNMV